MKTKIGEWLSRLPAEAEAHREHLARPLVTLSYAQSLDGSLALARGVGLAISGPDSMRLTHQLRAAHSAILVGIGTVLADDPQLTVRLVDGPNPRPIVVDSQLRIPRTARLLARGENLPLIITAQDAPEARIQTLEACGVQVLRVAKNPGGDGLDLSAALGLLASLGIDSLMVEGGARVISSFLALRLFDYALVTIAPMWVGGLHAVGGAVSRVGRFPSLRDVVYDQYGEDLVVWGRGDEQYAG